MTTSDHRHSNNRRETINAHHSHDNNQTNDVEIDSGMFEEKKAFSFIFLLIFFSNFR